METPKKPRQSRSLTISNIYSKKYNTFQLNGLWGVTMGDIERCGIILIYGREKHGKSTIALRLADELSRHERVLYVSAEEGAGMAFGAAMKRAGLQAGNRRIHITEYITIDELRDRLSKRKGQRVVVVDNLTIYDKELTKSEFVRLRNDYPNHLFIFVAHESKNHPTTAAGTLAIRLATVIIHVVGLTAFVSGRVPGGTIMIDERTANLYHGADVAN